MNGVTKSMKRDTKTHGQCNKIVTKSVGETHVERLFIYIYILAQEKKKKEKEKEKKRWIIKVKPRIGGLSLSD